MELQKREPNETIVSDDHDERFVSENFVKAAVIGALLGGVGFLLYRWLLHPTIPPIIIRSDETTPEPIEIETETILNETEALSGQSTSPHLTRKLYKMPRFGLTRYVVVICRNSNGDVTVREPYWNPNSGFVVQMWLQHKQGNNPWQNEPGSAHLVVEGTSNDFPLTCEQLSQTKNNSSPHRPWKRSFIQHPNKKWRIWKVQVGGNTEIELGSNQSMEIRFDNHRH